MEWMDLKFPPINLWNVPTMNTPYMDDTSGRVMINEHDIKDWNETFPGITKAVEKIVASGVKHDQGKPRMDLLDADALEGLAAVLTFGANKYAAHNWRGGLAYSRLVAALLRHTFALLRGERIDPESGLPHIDHVGCCWMFLSNQMKTRPDMDDLYKGKE